MATEWLEGDEEVLWKFALTLLSPVRSPLQASPTTRHSVRSARECSKTSWRELDCLYASQPSFRHLSTSNLRSFLRPQKPPRTPYKRYYTFL